MATLRDVALDVGVSPKTVSRVVNGHPSVTDETRAAVLDAIRRHNYVPNEAARSMRTATSNVVGLMTDVVMSTPSSVDIVRGAQSALREKGQLLLIGNSEGDHRTEEDYWRTFRSHKVSGVLYATMFHRAASLSSNDIELPLLLINCYDPQGKIPAVLPDDRKGGFRQVDHLLSLGHRRIGFVTLNPAIRATDLRMQGAADAFKAYGLPLDPSLIRSGYVGAVESEQMVAYQAALELLSGPDRPTAIVCGIDKIAVQVMLAALSLGLKVPEDVSLIGFDDMKIISETVVPGLTTVALPYFEMGSRAVELLPRIDGFDPLPKETLVDCPLVVRGSCRSLL